MADLDAISAGELRQVVRPLSHAVGRLAARLDLDADLTADVAVALEACLQPAALPQPGPPTPSGYARTVLGSDPRGRFTIVGILWLPGSSTPIHGHHVWCAFAIVCGRLTERRFEEAQAPRVQDQSILEPPAIRLDLPGPTCHQLANDTGDMAMSLHLYGVEAARYPLGVNRLFRPASSPGEVRPVHA